MSEQLTSSSSSPDGSSSSDCTVCSQPIPAKRLAALPSTTKCVECVVAEGDPRIRRFDDYYGTEAEHCESTLFFPGNQYFDKALAKFARYPDPNGDNYFDRDDSKSPEHNQRGKSLIQDGEELLSLPTTGLSYSGPASHTID